MASNEVLKIMGRKYSRESYLELVGKIKAAMPEVALTTDINVGYPNETEEQFQETWNEAVAGSRAVQLYLPEILDLCMTHLDSPQWALKHTAARAVADAAVAVSSSEAQMSTATGAALWPAIEKALGGKTWEGKEVVLSAFVKFVEVGKPYYAEQESVRSAITKVCEDHGSFFRNVWTLTNPALDCH